MTERRGRLPSVGEYVRNVGELVEVQDVTPPVTKVEDWIFRDTSARVEMRVGGKLVKEFGTFNNFYGRDRCVEFAIAEAKEQQKFYATDAVEFVVVKIVTHCRYRPARDKSFYAPEFVEFRFLEHGSGWNLPEETEEVVWSSASSV